MMEDARKLKPNIFHWRLARVNTPLLPLLCFIMVSFIAYWNALTMDFISDDVGRIFLQQHVFEQGLFYTLQQVLPDRPFLMTTVWLNFYFGGLNPIGYKIVNVGLHGCVAFVIWKLLKLFFGHQHSAAALLTALLFVVHPLQNQSINSIIQRGVTLSTLGVLLSLLLFARYMQSSSRHYYLLSLMSFLLALLSKQTAIVLPFLLIAYLVTFERRTLKHSIRLVLPFLALLAIPLIFYVGLNIDRQNLSLPWHEYLSVQTRVIFLYLKLFLFPVGLHFSYYLDPDPHLLHNLTWLAIIGHLAIFSSIYFAWVRGEQHVCFFATSMYLCFIPESSIFPINYLAFEHRTYLPFAFLFLVVFWVISKIRIREHLIHSMILIVVLILLAANLSYNAKINTYGKWALYNMIMSGDPSDFHFNDFHFTVTVLNHLYARNEIEMGKQVLSILSHRSPSERHYQIYQTVYEYREKDPTIKTQIRRDLTATLVDSERKLHPLARLFFNVFLIRTLSEMYPPMEGSLKVDALLYPQLPILDGIPELYGPRIFPRYAFHLGRLASHFESRGVESLNHYHTLRYLRVLAVLELYYLDSMQGENVSRDVEAHFNRAFKRFPMSPDLVKGYNWFKSQK